MTFEQYKDELDRMSKFDDRRVPMLTELTGINTIDAATLFRKEVETSLGDMDDNIYSPAKMFPLFFGILAHKQRKYYDLIPRLLAKCEDWKDRLSQEEAREVESMHDKAAAAGVIKTRWWQVWRTPIN